MVKQQTCPSVLLTLFFLLCSAHLLSCLFHGPRSLLLLGLSLLVILLHRLHVHYRLGHGEGRRSRRRDDRASHFIGRGEHARNAAALRNGQVFLLLLCSFVIMIIPH